MTPAAAMLENDLLAAVTGYLTTVVEPVVTRRHGPGSVLWMHQRPGRVNSRDGKPSYRTAIQGHRGFPDLVIVGPAGTLFRELKKQGGRFGPGQTAWLDLMTAAGLDAGVWRPVDWPHTIMTEIGAVTGVTCRKDAVTNLSRSGTHAGVLPVTASPGGGQSLPAPPRGRSTRRG